MRSSCSRSSCVNCGPKSSASYTRRISTTPSSPVGLGIRFAHSIASSQDLTCQSQKPAINSLVSANGPSTTVRLLPENLTRAPFEVGCSPSAARMMPALASSSLKRPISVSCSVLGRTPASVSLLALTNTMTRMSAPPLWWSYLVIERAPRKSTATKNPAEAGFRLWIFGCLGDPHPRGPGPLGGVGLDVEADLLPLLQPFE